MQRTTIGLDIAKRVFQAHAVDPASGEVTRTKLQRAELLQHFAQLQPSLIVMERAVLRSTGRGNLQSWVTK